jgi:hypothetical protein
VVSIRSAYRMGSRSRTLTNAFNTIGTTAFSSSAVAVDMNRIITPVARAIDMPERSGGLHTKSRAAWTSVLPGENVSVPAVAPLRLFREAGVDVDHHLTGQRVVES